MKRLITVLLLAALALALLATGATAASASGGWTTAPRGLVTFPAGDFGAFAEGMAADRYGNLWVSLTTWGLYDDTVDPPLMESNIGQLWRVSPGGKAMVKGTIDLTPYGMLVGVAAHEGRVYVGLLGAEGLSTGVYRLEASGKLRQVVALPEGSFPNGLAFHRDRLYITDSGAGAVWRSRIGAGVKTLTEPWLRHELLAPGDPEQDPSLHGLGANGIAFRGDRLFVSVSDFGRVVRVAFKADGSAGTPRVIAEDAKLKTADGIAFDLYGGLWITANAGTTAPEGPRGALYRLTPCAGQWTIADDPGWLNYPTQPVFGTTAYTRRTLYVENGDFNAVSAPDVQALRVGIPGLPVW